MDKLDAASEKVSSAKRKLEAQWGNLKNKMTSISLLGDAHHFDESRSKQETLRKLLDDTSAKKKLEGMKTITAMMTLGRDMSSYFPDVVKCVVVDNREVKQLVYRYLTHYAKEKRELALLAISSFQKDMKSTNQLVRGKALQAMSSLEVPSVIHLTLMEVKTAVKDSSAYVRKIACHCLPRLLRQNADLRGDIEEHLTALLADVEVMVLESVMYAFNQICPERWDLIHPHFRKLCHLLADMEPWGQILTLQMLVKYGRNQFEDPNKFRKNFNSDDEYEHDLKHDVMEDDVDQEVDPDHRLLLKSAKNLMYSMNAGVMMLVTAIHYYLAPNDEYTLVAQTMLGHLGRRREIDNVLLANIAVMCADRAEIYSPYYKRFYVNGSEPLCNKELKLDILSRLANEDNIQYLLREFQTYVKDDEEKFRCATIQAMGRCADQVPEVAESILRGLMGMASSHSQIVVASAIVVVRQIIQRNPQNFGNVIKSLIILLDKIEVAEARAAIVWIVGEYREHVQDYTLDVLRKLCKRFRKEDTQVKLQALNLAIKLFLHQANFPSDKQKVLKKLFKYLLDLCRFDQSYDIRDRCRLVRAIFLRGKKKGDGPTSAFKQEVRQKMQAMFLSEKPKPKITSPYKAREDLVLGTLSLVVMHEVKGYTELESFPESAPKHDYREVGQEEEQEESSADDKGFYSSDEDNSGMDEYKYSDSEDDSGSYRSDDDSSDLSDDLTDSVDSDAYPTEDSDVIESDDDDDTMESDSDTFDTPVVTKPVVKKPKKSKPKEVKEESSSDFDSDDSDGDREEEVKPKTENIDLLGDMFSSAPKKKAPTTTTASDSSLDFFNSLSSPAAAPTQTSTSTQPDEAANPKPGTIDFFADLGSYQPSGPTPSILDSFSTKPVEQFKMTAKRRLSKGANAEVCTGATGQLLSHAHSQGLQVDYAFSRKTGDHGEDFVRLRLDFVNKWNEPIRNIKITKAADVIAPASIVKLDPEQAHSNIIHIRFGGSQGVTLNIKTSNWSGSARLNAPPGELMIPCDLTPEQFASKQKSMMGGMSMKECKIGSSMSLEKAAEILSTNFNVKLIDNADFKAGDKVLRKGELVEIVRIDYECIPPACDVRTPSGGIVNTEFSLLTKPKADSLHKNFAATLLRDKSIVLFQVRGKNSVSVKVHCTEFMFMPTLFGQVSKCFKLESSLFS